MIQSSTIASASDSRNPDLSLSGIDTIMLTIIGYVAEIVFIFASIADTKPVVNELLSEITSNFIAIPARNLVLF